MSNECKNAQGLGRHAVTPIPSSFFSISVLKFAVSVIIVAIFWFPQSLFAAPLNELFLYSSTSSIRGINLTQQTEATFTNSPFTNSVNALDINESEGLVYYGSGTSIYYWDLALGTGANAHFLLNDFSSGPVQAPIVNIDSTAGSFFDGKYYIGSEANNGFIQDVFEITLSVDGRSAVSAQPLNLLSACGCTGVQLGGFGDVLTRLEGGSLVMYGASTDLTNNGAGTSAGRWKMNLSNNTWTLLQAGSGGQLAVDNSSNMYMNVGTSIRSFNPVTGGIGGVSLFTTSGELYELSRGFIFDFGDAPLSYGAPFHRQAVGLPATAYFGSNDPENEYYLQSGGFGGQDGAGDDNDGYDDEDAVATLPPLTVFGSTYSVNVPCVSGTAVTAWVDFNGSGSFDLNERNQNHPLMCTAGQATFQWSSIAPVAGLTYARFRTSIDANSVTEPVGYADDGEVEDHPLLISAPVQGNCPAGSTSTVVAATDLPLSIGPNAGTITTSNIAVPVDVIITDVNLKTVVGTHTYMADLIFDLKRNGSTVRLYGPTCNFNNNFNFGFDDAAGGSPPCPPTDGNDYPPTQSLSVFNGQSSTGTWSLEILDRFNGDSGQLQSWELELCSTENPDVRLGKAVSVSDNIATITLVAKNVGDVALSNVQITDNLNTVFGAGNYSIISAPTLVSAPSGFIANSSFTGQPGSDTLLSTSGLLQVDEELQLTFSVQVDNTSTSATGDFTNQANLIASSPNGANLNDLSGVGLDLSSDNDDPTPFNIVTGISLSGFVFEDSSADANSSHDGIFDSNEQGIGSRVVTIIDTATNATLGTVSTSSTGAWSYTLASSYSGQQIDVLVTSTSTTDFISEAPSYATSSVTDGRVSITPLLGNSYTGIDVGVIQKPQLQTNQSVVAEGGQPVRFAHTYIAPTHGLLTFTLSALQSPSSPAWSDQLWMDADCNGSIEPADAPVAGPTQVTPSQPVCLIVDLFVPANVAPGASSTVEILASLLVSDLSGVGHAHMQNISNQDLTTIGSLAGGRIQLSKTVTNITQSGAATTANSALPGDVLEYSILFSNMGADEVTELTINDQAPAYTSIDAASVQCVSVQQPVTCTPAVSGASVSWELNGPLLSGSTGSVLYRVTVD